MIGADYLLEDATTDWLADAATRREYLTLLAESSDIPLDEAVLACERISAEWHQRMAAIEAME